MDTCQRCGATDVNEPRFFHDIFVSLRKPCKETNIFQHEKPILCDDCTDELINWWKKKNNINPFSGEELKNLDANPNLIKNK